MKKTHKGLYSNICEKLKKQEKVIFFIGSNSRKIDLLPSNNKREICQIGTEKKNKIKLCKFSE